MSAHPAVGPSATTPAAVPASAELPGPRAPLRLPATLLLAGQLLVIAVTLLHTGGEANHHHDVFAAYARSGSWTLVHLGQFAGTALFLAGLLALFRALDGPAHRIAPVGSAAATATLALSGALQAVDGVALKQAVTAWAAAPDAERAARFAGAEAVRWIEWGLRSYSNVTLGLALLLLAAAVARAAGIPRPIAPLAALAGLSHLGQGWVVGSDGFSPSASLAIVAGFGLGVAWTAWLVVTAWRQPVPADDPAM